MTQAPNATTVQRNKPAVVFCFSLIILFTCGFLLVLYGTAWGAGLISDSFQYIASARTFASIGALGYPSEYGEIVPMTQYPPLFSIVLAFFVIMGMNALDVARWVNAILFGLNIILVAISVRQISRSDKFTLLSALLALVAFPLIETHSWALSEPLYLCLSLASLLLLAQHLEHPRRRWLCVAAGLVGLSFLTRYVGLALVVTALCALLLKRYQNQRQQLGELLAFAIFAILPMGVWTARSYFLTSTLNNRSVEWIPLTPKNLVATVNTVATWFIPNPLVLGREKFLVALGAIAIIGLGIAYYFFSRKSSGVLEFFPISGHSPLLYRLHGFYSVAYFVVIVVSKVFFDNNIGFTDRMLVPMLASLLIVLTSYFALLWKTDKKAIRMVILVLSAYLVLYHGTITAVNLPKQHRQGLGIARKSWHNSEIIQSLRSYHDLPVYSNSPSSLYLWSDRTGYTLQDFEQRVNGATGGKVVLVIFNHIPRNARTERLTEGLQPLKSDRIASIYFYEP